MSLLMDEKSDLMSNVQELLGFALGMQATMEVNQEQWKDEIRQKWVESRKFPRKKKKRERKSLLLDFSIASWSPYDEMGNFKS